jgi:phage gp45-like
MIQKGFLKRFTSEGRAEVSTVDGQILNNVQIIYPYGYYSKATLNNTSEILLFSSLGSKSNIFGIPYNVPIEPADLLDGELQIKNPIAENSKITFKQNGDIEIATNQNINELMENLNITANTKVTINATEIDLADAVSLVLNENASMDVTVTGGSSAGTYPVNINSAGQTKVKA